MRKGINGYNSKTVAICIILLGGVLLSVLSATAEAGGAYCDIPKDCKFISSEFSTGGGKKAFYIMEVDCEIKGDVVKYVDTELSAGGLLSIGRITAPRKIEFRKRTKDSMECDF